MPDYLTRVRPSGRRSPRAIRTAALTALTALALLAPTTLLGPASASPTADLGTDVAAPVDQAGDQAADQNVLARRARIKVRAPDSAEVGDRFSVRGRVKAGSGKRVVTVTEKRGKRWRKKGKDRTNRKGTFRISIRAGATEQTRRFRIQARARGRVVATARFRVQVETPRSPTGVTATWSGATAALDTPVSVSGVVTAVDPVGRTAVVQAELPSGWRDITSVPVNPDGSFSAATPSDWLSSLAMRVVVPASAASAEGVSATSVVTVTPTWAPPGSATDWAELSSATPLRYDPCQVIAYRTNLAGAPASAAAAVTEALRQITRATGLRFQHLGDTAALFDGEGPHAAYPGDSTLIIGFGTAAQTNAPFDGASPTIGWGGSSDGQRARSAALGNVWRIVKGGAVLKADHPWAEAEMLEALTHEVGHAVGLGHARVTDQVMYPVSEGANPVWGAGDLTGLRSAGLQSGCLTPIGRPARGDGDRFPGVIALP